MNTRVLIVEDDAALAEMLNYNLTSAGFDVVQTGDGDEAITTILDETPDLVILDWMLPNLSGIEICRQIRANPEMKNLPVIMLTAKGEDPDRVRGLDTGADDYVVKPYSPAELIARIKALLRRAHPELQAESLRFEDITMDLQEHWVTRKGSAIKLGPTEFRLLRVFMEKPGRVYSREQLLDKVWGRDIFVELRTVDVHIRRLRKALNADGQADPIRTVRAAGYALDSRTPSL
jgi:two-component system, OmpR family, phosphate regulon response regulator PhoB